MAHGPWTHQILKVIVVQGHITIAQVCRQRLPMVQAVIDRLGRGAAFGHAPQLQRQPGMERFPQWARQRLPLRQPLLRQHASQFTLNAVDRSDALHRLGRHGAALVFEQFVELASRMGQTTSGLAVMQRRHLFVALVFVPHQRARPTAQELHGEAGATAGAKVIDHCRHRVKGPAGIAPDVGPLCLARAWVEHGHRCLVTRSALADI
jgi:hypothetical protein